jgi:low affinity Fe/Cu permease
MPKWIKLKKKSSASTGDQILAKLPQQNTPYDRDVMIPLLVDAMAEKRLSRAIAWVIGLVVGLILAITLYVRIFFFGRWWVVTIAAGVALVGVIFLSRFLGRVLAHQANAVRLQKYEKLHNHHATNREDVAFAREQLRLAEERLAVTEKKLQKIIKSAENRLPAMMAFEAITAVISYNVTSVGHRTKLMFTKKTHDDDPFD